MTYQLLTIVGNVGQDAEIKYLRDGVAVTNFSVAVSKVTGKGDARKETTTWFKITIWREKAETAAQIVKKGARILVTGEVSASAFIDKKTGEARASLELTASEFRLLSSREETEGGEGGTHAGGNKSAYGSKRLSQADQDMLDNSDEIPF